MTLGSRLVIALAVLLTAGLAMFSIVTYTLYARTQYQQLDAQLRSGIPFIARQLSTNTGLGEQGPPAKVA
jgi:hypothetical protein